MTASTAFPPATTNAFDPLAAAVGRWGTERDGLRRYATTDVTAADREWLIGALLARRDLVQFDDDALTMLDVFTRRAFTESVTLESRAVATVELLQRHGIESRLLKGVATGHLDYEDPADRLFGDVDLLIRGSDVVEAVAALQRVGFRRRYREPYTGYDAVVGKGVAMEGESGTVVDLHRTIALGYFGTRLPIGELWEQAETFEAGGVTVSALSRLNRFLHCAIHLALAPDPKLVNGLDMCVIAGRADPLNAAEVVGRAESWGCAAPLARAVQLTTDWFGCGWAPAGLIEWSSSARGSAWERAALSTFHGRTAGSRWRTATAIVGLRAWPDRRLAVRGVLRRGLHRE